MFPQIKSSWIRPWFWVAVLLLLSLSIIFSIHHFPSLLYQVYSPSRYLIFHNLVEVISVIVSLQIFLLSGITYKQTRNFRNLFIGASFLGVAVMDTFHLFSFPGMPGLFTAASTHKGIYFWLVGRLLTVGALLLAAFLPDRKEEDRVFSFFSLLSVVLAVSASIVLADIFLGPYIPSFYIEGQGLTPLKIILEYIIMALGLAAFLAYRHLYVKEREGSHIYIMGGLIITVISEMCFTFYSSAYDTYNLLGHIYELIAYSLFFYALFIAQIKQPYNLLERTHRSLMESERRFRSLVEETELAVVELDPRGNIKYINPFLSKFTGYQPREILGLNWFTIFLKEPDRLAYQNNFNETFHDGLSRHFENYLLTRGGEVRYIAWNRIALKNSQGEITGAVSIGEDITARRRAEEELRSFAKNMDTIINSSSDIIVFKDKDFRFLLVNECCRKVFNAPLEDIIGKTDFDFMPREVAEECRKSDEKALNSDDSVSNEECVGDMWLHVVKRKVVDAESRPIGVVAVMRDITERKRSEEALIKSEQELRLLSAQLMNAQEKERKRIAQELHDGLGQSLSATKFRIENLFKSTEKGIIPENVQILSDIVIMLQQAVEEVRRICMDLRPSILDDLGIMATLAWLDREFKSTYPAIQLELDIRVEEQEIPEKLKIVIYRVVQESLNNIAKHSKARYARLLLGKNEGNLELVIEDDGRGFSLEEASSREFSQRGIGLSSMRERMELSGGIFTIESVKGEGTKKRFLWP